jgi:hypothetical protein
MKLKCFFATGLSLVLALYTMNSVAQTRVTTVQFERGTDSISIPGHLEGREYFDYLVRAKAGQTMIVSLDSNNRFAFFNVMPPGTGIAIFVGSTLGDRFESNLPATGEYTIRIYLVRAAARRGEKGSYMLDVRIPAGSPKP